jgi:hypothetical protein
LAKVSVYVIFSIFINDMKTKHSPKYTTYKKWNDLKGQGTYGIFDGNDGTALYIGSTVAINRRWNRHKTCVKNIQYAKDWYPGQVSLYVSLNKHTNLIYAVLDKTTVNLRQAEKFWITTLKPLYNKQKIK